MLQVMNLGLTSRCADPTPRPPLQHSSLRYIELGHFLEFSCNLALLFSTDLELLFHLVELVLYVCQLRCEALHVSLLFRLYAASFGVLFTLARNGCPQLVLCLLFGFDVFFNFAGDAFVFLLDFSLRVGSRLHATHTLFDEAVQLLLELRHLRIESIKLQMAPGRPRRWTIKLGIQGM